MALRSDEMFGLTRQQFTHQNDRRPTQPTALAAEEARRKAATPESPMAEFIGSRADTARKKADVEQ